MSASSSTFQIDWVSPIGAHFSGQLKLCASNLNCFGTISLGVDNQEPSYNSVCTSGDWAAVMIQGDGSFARTWLCLDCLKKVDQSLYATWLVAKAVPDSLKDFFKVDHSEGEGCTDCDGDQFTSSNAGRGHRHYHCRRHFYEHIKSVHTREGTLEEFRSACVEISEYFPEWEWRKKGAHKIDGVKAIDPSFTRLRFGCETAEQAFEQIANEYLSNPDNLEDVWPDLRHLRDLSRHRWTYPLDHPLVLELQGRVFPILEKLKEMNIDA